MKYALLLDTETTGLDPATDHCIEVACILYDLESAAPIMSYASLIHASDNAAEPVNRIPVAALLDAPLPAVTWSRVSAIASRSEVIIAHGAEFDRSFSPDTFAVGVPWCCSLRHIEWPTGKQGSGLANLALAHGLGVASAHRAMTDCDTLSRLLTRVHEMGHPLPALIARAMRPRVKLQAIVSYDDREQAKLAGFAWDGDAKRWWREVFVDDVAALPFPTRPIQ